MCVLTSKMTEEYLYVRRTVGKKCVWFIIAIAEQFSILTVEKHLGGTLTSLLWTEFFQKRTEKEN